MIEVIMPKMGDGMEEGTLLEWLKNDGDAVKSGEPIANIQTDKATLEMEAPAAGKLGGILVQAGANVPVGKPMAAILQGGESLPKGWGSGDSPAPKVEPKTTSKSETASPAAPAEPAVSSHSAEPASNGSPAKPERIKASPLAKRVADELGVNLAQVTGSGPGGRIVEKDVRALASAGGAPATPVTRAVAASQEDQFVPLNKLRQITAQRTAESKREAPHFYVTVEVDVENLLALRKMFERDDAPKPSVNDFVIRASALALREMPVVNSIYHGDKLLQLGAVHIGMAVALDDGLTVPVLKNADQLSLAEIAAQAKALAEKARANRLSLDELSGGGFSISNMGMLNVDTFAAILNPPNAAIVAVGTAKKRAVVDEESGEIVARTRMNLTGSFDHRVVDGAVGARFMNLLREYLEKPTRLL